MTTSPDHLMEVELAYREGKSRMSDGEGKVGHYLGSGDGTVMGPKIQGTVQWDLFENQAPEVCDAHLHGIITTEDGARIDFDVLGFFRAPSGPERVWSLTASVVFGTKEPQYGWRADSPYRWEGTFDESTYRHHYRVTRA